MSKRPLTAQNMTDETKSMSSAGFETANPAFEGAHTYPLDRKAIGIGSDAHKLLIKGLLTATTSFHDILSKSCFRRFADGASQYNLST